jgi:tetratricopeptide (TPR) repeat protein
MTTFPLAILHDMKTRYSFPSSLTRLLSLGAAAALLTLTLPGCNGSKAFVKRAGKMEEAGMMPQAANLYYTAVVKKPTNIDAMVGLKRTGQIVLGQHISSFDEAVAFGQRETALDAWHDAEAWNEKLSAVGVDLFFPEAKRASYEAVKNAHLDATYRQANILLEQEMFAEALLEFDAILALDPTYQDAPALRNVAFCEPRYREGVLAQETDRYRAAHSQFAEVVGADASYKDANDRLNQVLEDGRFTVAMTEFKNGSSRVNLEVKIQTLAEQALMSSEDPFLKVVDRESLALILQEQSMGMSGLTTGGDVEIGNLLGAKALLKATVTTCDHRESRLQKSYQTGYEQYKVERVNEEGKKYYETKYRQVQYREFVQDASVDIACTFKFISTTTGEVVASETIYGRASDNIRYIEYDGNASKFYLGGNSGARTDGLARSERDRLLSSRRAIRSADALTDEAGQALANQIQAAVERELLNLIP